MKLTKCINGHFYDAEKYSVCPHCSGTSMDNGGDDSVTDCIMPKQGQSSDSAKDKTVGMNMQGLDNKIAQNETVKFSESIQRQQNSPVYNRTVGQSDQEDEGKTIGYMSWKKKIDNDVTEPIFRDTDHSSQPVVGWLVCTEGKSVGRSYNLYCGKNFIGRSSKMDIALIEDITVSRIRPAIIVYEPNNRVFFAQPGDSHELFYLNGNVVLNSIQLKDRDVITLGKTSMIFVAFCDERFGWD